MSSYWNKYLTDNSLFKFGEDKKTVDELTQSLNKLREVKDTMAGGMRNDVNVFNHPYKIMVNDNIYDDEHGDNIQW